MFGVGTCRSSKVHDCYRDGRRHETRAGKKKGRREERKEDMERISRDREEMNGRSYLELLMLVNDTMRFQSSHLRDAVNHDLLCTGM